MRVGTKSVLFGAHQFLIHPWFVAAGWWKMYGFPWDPRLWIAFFVHDLGYLGKPSMDGPEGELHPYLGAKIMRVFGEEWFDFVLYHSRYLASEYNEHYSKLCVADKMAIAMTPAWLYLPLATLTGEIREYIDDSHQNHPDMNLQATTPRAWYKECQDYCRRWALTHREGHEDTWTQRRNR